MSEEQGSPKLISLVIPVYYNEENIPVTWQVLRETLETLPHGIDWEVIFIDDGSGDDSFARLCEVRESAPERVCVLKLLRNFGQYAAILAGLQRARGDACVVMSADLQDPPELILEMARRWADGGHKIVLCTRNQREDGKLAAWTSRIFYRLMRRYAIPNMPEGGFDYFLIDRCVIDILQAVPERNGFLQGQVLWAGHDPSLIPYTRRKRKLGRSRWTLSMKLAYFFDGFVSYSIAPIRLITAVGILVSLLSFGYAGLILGARLVSAISIAGWAACMVSILMLSGVQLVMLGIIGEYLWRTYQTADRRPAFIIEAILDNDGGGGDTEGELS